MTAMIVLMEIQFHYSYPLPREIFRSLTAAKNKLTSDQQKTITIPVQNPPPPRPEPAEVPYAEERSPEIRSWSK